jgi:glyoxylase-like metal-dependent hydrolase (beta-lactamase superfamily II)
LKTRSFRTSAPAKLRASVAALLTLCALGAGSTVSATERQGLDTASILPPFVPLATPLPDTASEYEKHMLIATVTWQYNDDITKPWWCSNPGQGSNPNLADRTVIPMTPLFDGFYFTGTVSVGQFVMKTPDGGYMLFDTMNNATDVDTITIPQLTSAGIDPAKLRAIVVTHGHGDHDGGAARLQALYDPPVVIVGSADYTTSKPYVATLKIDSTDLTPRPLEIQGVDVTVQPTPGHTPGTTSYILNVTYKGHKHKIAYWGGSAFPSNAAAALQYMRGAEYMYDQIKEQQVDASINSHSFEDKLLDRMKAINAQGGIGISNPMIQGTAKIQLGFATLRSCSAAQLSNRDATARNPVWRPTRTELFDAQRVAKTAATVVRARVSNYFNVINGGRVEFTTPQGDSCAATTNVRGVATCTIRSASRSVPLSVKAEFTGMAGDNAVELTSTDTRSVNITPR